MSARRSSGSVLPSIPFVPHGESEQLSASLVFAELALAADSAIGGVFPSPLLFNLVWLNRMGYEHAVHAMASSRMDIGLMLIHLSPCSFLFA
jgi:hypothetical protein